MANAVAAADIRTTQHVAVQSILQRSVCLVLSCSYFGNSRKVRSKDAIKAASNDDTSVNEDVAKQLHITKHLVDSKVLRKANAIIAAAKAYLKSTAIAAHGVFGEGAYLVPVTVVEQVDARLCEFVAALAIEVELLAMEWDAIVAEQEIALGPLFKRSEYMTADELRREFQIDWSYVSFATPERLEHVNHALFESAQRKFAGRMAQAYDEVKLVLRQTLLEVTKEIAKKLAPGEDGKPKVFRDTILDPLAQFFQTFDVRNISDDRELEEVVSTLKGLTRGLDPQKLRDLDRVREDVFEGVRAATSQLDAMIQTGRRGIAFGGF